MLSDSKMESKLALNKGFPIQSWIKSKSNNAPKLDFLSTPLDKGECLLVRKWPCSPIPFLTPMLPICIVPVKTKTGPETVQPARAVTSPRYWKGWRCSLWVTRVIFGFLRSRPPRATLIELYCSLQRGRSKEHFQNEPQPWLHVYNYLRKLKNDQEWASDPRGFYSVGLGLDPGVSNF